MLTAEGNERLTRIGPVTPMGKHMRFYWLSFYPDADGQPKRVKILGEDIVIFRDSESRPGQIANACPHRGATLILGPNEEFSIRCFYHG